MAESGKQMLQSLGYTVAARTSSIEAFEAFRAKPDHFDLIITDNVMPNMSGVELVKKIKRLRPDIPIILCTGFSEGISQDKFKAIGIADFLMKPIIRETIARTIRQILDKDKSIASASNFA